MYLANVVTGRLSGANSSWGWAWLVSIFENIMYYLILKTHLLLSALSVAVFAAFMSTNRRILSSSLPLPL